MRVVQVRALRVRRPVLPLRRYIFPGFVPLATVFAPSGTGLAPSGIVFAPSDTRLAPSVTVFPPLHTVIVPHGHFGTAYGPAHDSTSLALGSIVRDARCGAGSLASSLTRAPWR
ncbi:hypothetical protein [Nocardia thraciensis]